MIANDKPYRRLVLTYRFDPQRASGGFIHFSHGKLFGGGRNLRKFLFRLFEFFRGLLVERFFRLFLGFRFLYGVLFGFLFGFGFFRNFGRRLYFLDDFLYDLFGKLNGLFDDLFLRLFFGFGLCNFFR